MRIFPVIAAVLLFAAPIAAQKRSETLDYNLKPTQNVPRYFVTIEKKDSGWQRLGWFVPESSLAFEGWYADEACQVPQGKYSSYHTTRYVKETGNYVQGKKVGAWLGYNEEGIMVDSAWYDAGRLKGVSMSWYKDGMPADSAHFDGAGKGVRISWYEDGTPRSAGIIINDTAKSGRWKYFHRNGTLKAIEEYTAGTLNKCLCYDEQGKQLPDEACEEKDADFVGGESGWRRFLERNLNAATPVNNKAPLGSYTVIMQFVVQEDGTVTDIKPLTKFGYGMEQEVERMLRKAPKWVPAQQHGTKVKAYRRQPVTFVVSQG